MDNYGYREKWFVLQSLTFYHDMEIHFHTDNGNPHWIEMLLSLFMWRLYPITIVRFQINAPLHFYWTIVSQYMMTYCALLWLETLRWRHMNVMQSQITGHSTVCLTAYADPHQRSTKVRITDPLWREFTGHRWIPTQRGSDAEKLPFGDVIMISCLPISYGPWRPYD